MQTVIFAAFSAPSEAEWASAELLQRGALLRDLTVIAQRTPENPCLEAIEGRLDVADHDEQPNKPEGASPLTPDLPASEELPILPTPFGDVPGEPHIQTTTDYPGELAARLCEAGIGDSMAHALERIVMIGGAILLAHTPTGQVDDVLAWHVIEQCGGSGIATTQSGPYLS